MCRSFLIFVVLLLSNSFVRAQFQNSISVINSTGQAISLACDSSSKGLGYLIRSNGAGAKVFKCDGNSWVETEPGNKNAPEELVQSSDTAGIAPVYFTKLNRKKEAFHGPSTGRRQIARKSGNGMIELSGAVYFGYSATGANTTTTSTGPGLFSGSSEMRSRNLSLGVDLHLRSYVLDPRFISFSADIGMSRDKGSFEDYSTRNGVRGIGFSLDFLGSSQYPLRFRFRRNDTNFINRTGDAADSERSVFGINWQFVKPGMPRLMVNYDRVTYNTKFLATSFFRNKGQSLSVTANDDLLGWDVNASYNYQSTIERMRNFRSRQNFLQLFAKKDVTKDLRVFFGSFAERIEFTNPAAGSRQGTTLASTHINLSYQLNESANLFVSHRFYYNRNTTGAMAGWSGDPSDLNRDDFSLFNSFGSHFTYRVVTGLVVGATADFDFINSPTTAFEKATRSMDASATVAWSKRLGDFYVHAGTRQGMAYVSTNFDNSRGIAFRSYNAGVSYGNAKRLLFSTDYNYSHRPDIYQIGGFFSENNFRVNLTTEIFSPFRVSGTVGVNNADYLTLRGKEDFKKLLYSATIQHRMFTLGFSRNSNDGFRDIFADDFPLPSERMFIILPRDLLIRDPFSRSKGLFDCIMLRAQPRRDLLLELRYVNDRVDFVETPDSRVRQLDAIASYRLGKFTFSAGMSRQRQNMDSVLGRTRSYYFFRATRTFKIF